MTAGSLAGKTLFITGASRGIGLAIAMRAARDGANIAVAAKTAAPHPRLPGTIHTAAEAIEKAGGHALPLVVDVRDEAAVQRAVEQTADHFGGIDICVNNASALNVEGTLDISMKAFDLMHQVNVRATFMTSKFCLPYLLKSSNPHILAIAPKPEMNPAWYSEHLGYSLAKLGMGLAIMGLAGEFREQGVAANALWPRTIIGTAAVEFGSGLKGADEGEKRLRHARRPEIMADAAHVVLTAPSRELTGQFLLDDDVLARSGVSDFSPYQIDPSVPSQIDAFIWDDAPPVPKGVSLIGREPGALDAY
ncbi:SDR family oxidoreductase [Novosphingobium pentaromativorans]|uniref:Short chain dehydrogenase family protein n=1 Tax=Novosphingobium pentaromativorans US6-1 TaxID=1088721 RepID=G6E7Y9_9SPHN|nr:NAD(P)-dependent oxidoreductase [Novosphingobium pentaromativorans]AIT81493.1 short-chain dehydrogenase [Novosphingobium pentaromativorans US6-1]EHJ62632.1 short chain dehydrogenase family protein [Novosphingobium pentaromativorans US6-1]